MLLEAKKNRSADESDSLLEASFTTDELVDINRFDEKGFDEDWGQTSHPGELSSVNGGSLTSLMWANLPYALLADQDASSSSDHLGFETSQVNPVVIMFNDRHTNHCTFCVAFRVVEAQIYIGR